MIDTLPQALFLDRDGTLIKWVDYLHDPNLVELEPGIGEALKRAKAAGCLLFIHTNQSGVGRGYFAMDAVLAVNRRMYELMGVDEAFFDGVCIAPDEPNNLEEGSYRKPSPRYELEMMNQYSLLPSACYMIGDSLSDVKTGIDAGMNSVLVRSEQTGAIELPDSVLEYASVADFLAERF